MFFCGINALEDCGGEHVDDSTFGPCWVRLEKRSPKAAIKTKRLRINCRYGNK